MTVCLIGAKGHYAYAINDITSGRDFKVAGIAPGFNEEDMHNVAAVLNKYGIMPADFTDYIKMLESVRPDVAIIASRFDINSEIAEKALEFGCSVFVEKPLALTLEKLNSLLLS